MSRTSPPDDYIAAEIRAKLLKDTVEKRQKSLDALIDDNHSLRRRAENLEQKLLKFQEEMENVTHVTTTTDDVTVAWDEQCGGLVVSDGSLGASERAWERIREVVVSLPRSVDDARLYLRSTIVLLAYSKAKETLNRMVRIDSAKDVNAR